MKMSWFNKLHYSY